MRKFYITISLLVNLFVSGQSSKDSIVNETTIIKRIGSTEISTATNNKTLLSAAVSATNTPTGSSDEVGITTGELNISLSGNASYTIPISIPKGLNNAEPQISLIYNSQNGLSGNAARGWDISGVSSITRIPSTKFHDGIIDPVDFNSLDRFALDGQRLIVKNGTTGAYGADKTVYETEYFSNIRITSFGVSPFGANYGPAYFLVEYPDGSKAYYGNSTDSRSIMEWSILYFENPQGVRINYTYTLLNNTLYIDSIKYGALVSGTHPNEVKFTYEDRGVPENYYVGGLNVIRSKRLKEIKVITNGIGFRNYGFSYLVVDRINKVTETSGDGTKSYNPTLFDYEMTSEELKYIDITTSLNIGNIKSLNVGAVSGDFDGDGKMDCLVYPTLGSDAKTKYWLYAGIESGDITNMGLEHPVGAFEDIFPATFLSSDNKVLPQGWVVVRKSNTDYTFSVYGMERIIGNVNIIKQYDRMVSIPKTIFPKKIVSGDFNGDGLTDILIIDSQSPNGDIVSGRQVYFIDLKRDNTNYLTLPGELLTKLSGTARVEVADFNGDGKSDLFIFDTGILTIYSFNVENKLVVLYKSPSFDSAISTGFPYSTITFPILIGDYNGDGKSDIMIPKGFGSSQWYKYTSTGTTMIKEEKTYLPVFDKNDSYTTYNYFATDFNNDGRADLIRVKNAVENGKGFISVFCHANTNGDFVLNPKVSSTQLQPDINIYALPVFLPQSLGSNSTLNKVNSTLEIAFFNNNKIHFFNSGYDYKKSNLLTNITTGNGVQEAITYIPLDTRFVNTYQYTNIYKSSKGIANYPNLDIIIDPNLYVVSKLERQSKDVYKKKLFAYYGAVTNVEGLGFMGFRSVSRTDWYDDTTAMFSTITKNDLDLRGANIENYYVQGFREPLIAKVGAKTPNVIVKGQNEDYTVITSDNLIATESITLKPNTTIKAGSTFSAKIVEGANNSPNTPTDFITKSISNYENDLLANKVFRLKNTVNKVTNTIYNTNVEESIRYDTYDNPLKTTTLVKEGTSTIQTTVDDTDYYNNVTPTSNIVGRPLKKSQSVAVTGSTMTSEEKYDYYANGLLKQKNTKGTNTNYITEDYDYDGFGNLLKNKVTAVGLSPRETSYGYDTSGRFLTKITDVEKRSTTFKYNPNGTLKSETNPYNLTTSYTYDSWFKKLTTKDEKLNKTISYAYSRNEEKTVVSTTTDALDGSASEETFDDLGRKIKTSQKDLNGNFSSISFMYDIFDRNYKTSEPYFGVNPVQWNETKFDIYSRPEESKLFTTRTVTAKYDGLKSSVIDGQKTKSVIKNAIGNVVSSTETTGGTIKYDYYANGNLKQTDYNGVKIIIEQDGWGRKSKMKDPSAGEFTYKNNDLGELETETSKNGEVVTTITRDSNGKPTKKTVIGSGTDTETTYKYDLITQLITEVTFKDKKEPAGKNEIITTYTYDDIFKRVIKIVEDKTSISKFTTSFTYDDLGRVDTETKQVQLGTKISTVTTKREYKNGGLYKIIADDTTKKILWQTNELNAKGQITESVLGNGIKTTSEYDTNGYLSKIKYDKANNQGNILTLDTQFDFKTDNLENRTNSAFNNYKESFKYDEIDRLTKFTNKLGIEETQNYEVSGKIKNNSLGTYNYSAEKPYQNTSITLAPEAYGYYASREGIFNDSMENRTGWSLGANNPQCISFDDTKAHTGKNSLKINTTVGGVTTSYVQADAAISIVNVTDTDYTFSGWVYTDNPTAQLTLFMYKTGETGYYTNVKSVSTNTKNSWIYITETFKVPSNITSLRLRLDVVGSGNVWFDDVQIRKTSNPATTERKLDITYNAFKSPLQIIETGVDKINFTYNDNNQRSTMYDEGLKLRKHYSADGTIEIKENTETGTAEFITYIGGDGYSAPIALKSDGGGSANYLYLHRDYQGTILAITDANATVAEKRLFDAWGSIIKVQDGSGKTLSGLTILDRGYTGHEHLQSVGLINMNARLYDPMLHRFLQVDNYIQDPTNTQNYNQYGYVVNNPLKYTDPSGNAFGDGKDCRNCPNNNYPVYNPDKIQDHKPLADGINHWVGGWASARNIDEAGTALGKAVRDGINFIGRNIGSLFGGGNKSSGPPPNRSSYLNLNTTSLIGAPVNPGNLDSGNWYGPGGQVNWAFGVASTIGVIKGGLNSERMYAEGIRRGISANYELSGRNLSMFRDAPMTKATIPRSNVGEWAGRLGKGSFYLGLAMDAFGVWNYKLDPNSPNAVHPAKAGLNTVMGAMGTWGTPLMAIPSTLYFGIDAFYPKGWGGLAIDQESLYRDNRAINPNYQAFPGAMKF